MPQIDTPGMQLRIFCICGQKMKVSSTMFGRPGKCVACRQKIRIPRMDEIPTDVTEISLKDFPQFLRTPKAPVVFSEVERAQGAGPDTDDGDGDLALGDGEPAGPAVPLDPLEPLRILCSLEEKIDAQLAALKKNSGPTASADKATLVRYRTLVRNSRSAFDDRLRDRLVESTDQLNGVKESLARAYMSMRIAELNYDEYQQRVRPLREQRDRLERRIQNLRGWLVTSSPDVAGGYLDVRLEDVPVEAPSLNLPAEVRATVGLLEQHIEGLRNALRERADCERKLTEWQRIERERALPQAEIERGRRESEGVRTRAAEALSFARARLEQAAQDAEQDNKAIRSYLEALRSRVQGGELDTATFKAQELRLLSVQNDNTSARALARRALAANSHIDVPRPVSSLMQRLADTGNSTGLGADSWFAWAASALLALNIAVPLTRHQPAGNMAAAPGFAFGLFIAAAALALIALIPRRPLRAALLSIAWVVLCVGGGAYLHEVWYSPSAIGVAMRLDPTWFTSPGLLLLALAGMVAGLAASVSVLPVRELRRAPAMAAAVILVVLCLLLTDVFGVLTARPTLEEPTIKPISAASGESDVRIDLGNAGWRTLQLGGDARFATSPATFVLERRVGNDSWEDVTLRRLNRESLAGQLSGRAGNFPSLELAGGEHLRVAYRLTPGTYRVQVQMNNNPAQTQVRNFTLAEGEGLPDASASTEPTVVTPPGPRAAAPAPAPAETVPDEPAAEAEPAAPEATTSTETTPAAQAVPAGAAEVVLQGVINAAGRDPRFIVILTLPGADPKRSYLALGETVAGKWKAAEFNPGPQTLTLNDGERLLVLERGVKVTLSNVAEPAAPAAPAAPASTTPDVAEAAQ